METPPFIGRGRERAVLEELHGSGRPELFVLYGRRRVGKTELLQQFCQAHRSVYFLAAQVRDRDNLRAFRDAIAEACPMRSPATSSSPTGARRWASWPSARAASASSSCSTSSPTSARRRRASLAAAALLGHARQEEQPDGGPVRQPDVLHGEGSACRALAALRPAHGAAPARAASPPEALGFFPRWKLEDRLLAYGILGGMPAYLSRFDDRSSLRENLLRVALRPEGYLFDEVDFLLRAELSNPATYNSLLAALARGGERLNDIALDVGVDSTTANKYLHVLRELRLVEREVPLTDPDPLRSRRGTYRIADRFLAFHFRHVQPNLR
jgi:AAA+ ATPase superfamily predicted ATPase